MRSLIPAHIVIMFEYHLPPGFCSRRQRGQTLECLRRIDVVRDPRAKEACYVVRFTLQVILVCYVL